ncbi:unnamed protein product [Thlaspi arvense]|uniref:Uncharacterized protein n=1 Tax=Thlaspi arvense TaxID=13288 RepID=A0AAU9SQG0_THLAR|nr:unnamed protein product [Thlaspi arvense]
MRDDAYLWIKLRVQNGRSCRFWTDNWSPFGNIEAYLQGNGYRRLGISKTATLSSLQNHGDWTLPPARSDNQVNLQIFLSTITLTEEENYYEWEIDERVSSVYSTGQVYEKLREDSELVPWDKMQILPGGKLVKRLTLLAWQASIYWIWTERNGHLHRQIYRPADAIITLIDRQVRNRITSYRDNNPTLSSQLLQLWFMTDSSP